MAEPDKPEEKKPTQNQEAFDDLLWEIPFSRPIANFFIREGNAVKNGWLAVAVMVGLAVWITHSRTESGIDEKLSGITNYFNGQISDIQGQLTDAKQDRDKYQLMLAPFQAAALKIYTNAPLDQRLEIFAETLNVVTNELASDRPVLHLEINGTKPTSVESPKLGESELQVPLLLNSNRQIDLEIFND